MFTSWHDRFRSCARLPLLVGLGLLSAGVLLMAADSPRMISPGALEFDTRSDFSRIRVYRNGSVRTMAFVRDSGEEAYESQVDLNRPYDLHFQYLQYMFVSYLFRPQQTRVLLVGVGGGSMIHFLQHYNREVKIDAVEIDPVVMSLAKKYFGVESNPNVNLVTEDGVKFLENTDVLYDVIYLDAFLKPSAETDGTGAPTRLRTTRFYETVQKKLQPDGLVVFNLNPHQHIDDDLALLEKVFPQTYVFRLPAQEGVVVVGSTAKAREDRAALNARAVAIDRRFHANFSFQAMLRTLDRKGAASGTTGVRRSR